VNFAGSATGAGGTAYLEVIDASEPLWRSSAAPLPITGQRWITRVTLIRALGGGLGAARYDVTQPRNLIPTRYFL